MDEGYIILEVSVNINRKQILAQLHAVRTKPKGCKIEDGTECTYNIVYSNHVVDTMTGKYGCGLDLAIKLLEKWKDNSNLYKAIAFMREQEGI